MEVRTWPEVYIYGEKKGKKKKGGWASKNKRST
jgi:hypothetical protein